MMPVIFVGHGSPMNAIEENEYTNGWKQIAKSIPKPSAILCISAHWETKGTKVSTLEQPKTIHDFYGFPRALYEVEYKAEGSPAFAKKVLESLGNIAIEDKSWGLDHGTWSVLKVMYPEADIPVFQMSIDNQGTPEELFEVGKMLRPLRESNVLIMGSGNVVHNLGLMDFSQTEGFDWAVEFDGFVHENILQSDYEALFNYRSKGEISRYSVPTTEHLYPLFYILGAAGATDKVTEFNRKFMAGSLAMTSYVFF